MYIGHFSAAGLLLSLNPSVPVLPVAVGAAYPDLLWPFITMNSLDKRTLPVGLQILNSAYAGSYRPMVLAGAVFATVPIVIFYIIFQRRIIKGVTMTGMGGR